MAKRIEIFTNRKQLGNPCRYAQFVLGRGSKITQQGKKSAQQ